MSNILVVDDESSICWGLSQLGATLGHEVRAASSAEEGLKLAEEQSPDLIILDVRLPGMDGLAAMTLFRRYVGDAPIIVVTAFGDLATAVKAIEQGAFEYVLKPFDLTEIRAAIERALQERVTVVHAEPLTREGMLGESAAMQAVFKRIALAAASDAGVLLAGESGVGKELAASAIHRHSNRCHGPFVAVNIAALSPSLAEAELFGHAPGAFTGAQHARKGLLVQADGGTLFIDEVADIPGPLQGKLLRALDQGEVLPVGADSPVTTNFRIVSATHKNLRTLVQTGDFRHDLFYRLCTFEIEVPALRDRSDDIPLLAKSFAREFGADKVHLADETIAELQRRPWFGNIRELRNAIEHAVVLARQGAVTPGHLPAPLPRLSSRGSCPAESNGLRQAADQVARDLLNDAAASGEVYERFLQAVEPPLLAAALDHCHQCAPAARALGLHRTTLKRKLQQYGLTEGGE